MKTYLLHPLAEEELYAALEWYENRLPGLGAKFLERVHEGLNHIVEFPESCPVKLGRARIFVLRQFPYNIIYSLDSKGIFVLALAHHKRDFGYWLHRL